MAPEGLVLLCVSMAVLNHSDEGLWCGTQVCSLHCDLHIYRRVRPASLQVCMHVIGQAMLGGEGQRKLGVQVPR